ncbi:hypothetical protein CSQ85_09230 [Bifidobacterium rousetti]|uniref:RCC1 domain-containing protein n=1 Tax=Bifidobacterium rousetti TaxID=2045439 RepID=UPI0012386000|nr:SdrD B-like domain-containing protein [Bifidobacterium rousetti]KAA8818333.1 hypothetical protein CSQ85_09230 [Bifidobacterium rousetti]
MNATRPFHTITAMLALAGMAFAEITAQTVTPPPAFAAEPTVRPSYATAKLIETRDGTGHGTSAQTFVNSDNGFPIGDDDPKDGVVSSGDTVEYSLKLSFTAAQKRQVKVAWNLQDAPYLQAGDVVAGYCQSGQLVTAAREGDACVYTVPAGAVETLDQKLVLTAKDTGGVAQKNQQPKLTVSRVGETGSEVNYPSDEVTVVSAPAADLIMDNGGFPDKPYGAWERRATWASTGSLTGRFDLKVKPLTYPGYTTSHGASTSGLWNANVNVSKWPTDTVWTLGGKTLPVKDGMLRLEHLTGDQTLDWSMPATAVKDMQPGSQRVWDIQITPDKGSFASTGADALQNMGDGTEPGMNQPRDQSTASTDTGSLAGYPYANNDWTRGIVNRPDGVPGYIYWKELARPYTPGKTLFDPESLDFQTSTSNQTVYHNDTDTVAGASNNKPGAQVRTTLGMRASNITGLTAGQHPVMQDNWDPKEQHWDGDLTVTQDGQPLTMGEDYTVLYTHDDPTSTTAAWHDGIPDPTDTETRGVRIVFNQNAHVTYGPGAGDVRAVFLMRVIADTSNGNVKVDDRMHADITTSPTGKVGFVRSDYVWAIPPANPSNSIDNTVTVTDTAGTPRKNNDATPGDTATYTLHPTISNIQLSNTSMTPTVTIPYPNGLINPQDTDGSWKLTVTGSGKDRKLVFTLNTKDGKTTPTLDPNGNTTFPTITWKATVGNKATGTITAAATLSVDVDANGVVPAHPKVTSNTASAQFTVSNQAGESGILTADKSKVEINDPMSFSFNLYAKGQGRTGTAVTVIHAPGNDDKNLLGDNNTGLDGSWNEYDRGSSKYAGTWKLDKPVSLNEENSTNTTVMYSTTVKWTDDPEDYQWKTWEQLTATEKSNITAIRVTSTFEQEGAGSMPVAAANGQITITPSGNVKDDQYNMWPGRTRFSDGHAMGNLPWADRTLVVAGSISGTVWWDRDENTIMDSNEERIPNIQVSLWQVDQNGNHVGDKPLTTTPTDDKGYYEFTLLHSGSYKTEVKRNEGETTSDGVQTKVTTYYNQQKNVTNTYSWNWQLRKHARDDSDRIDLYIGQNQTRVDFGYAKPDPKATLDKTQTKLNCDDTSCEVNWDVKITNNGKSTGKLPNGATIETLSAGGSHSLAIGSDGNTYAWGNNSSGQLGNNSTDASTVPVKVTMPEGVHFTQVSGGYSHSLAIGDNGNTYAWGNNYSGQLGNNSTDASTVPVLVTMPDGVHFTQVSAGYYHSLAIGDDGNTYAWGNNIQGELGNNSTNQSNVPVMVKMPEGVHFTQVSAGDSHSLAIGDNGNTYAWGDNYYGQLGNDSTNLSRVPVKVTMPEGVRFTQVSAGYRHSLAIGDDGNTYAWGANWYGELGNASTNQSNVPVQVKIPKAGVHFTQVSAGYYHSLAIGDDDNAYAWGNNNTGQLGNASTNQSNVPVQVKTPDGVHFTQVSADYGYSLAIGSDGNTYAWGRNINGQLGDESTDEHHTPVTVHMPAGVTTKPGTHTPDDTSNPSAGTSSFPTTSRLSDRMSNAVKNVTATAGTTSRTPDKTVRFKQVSAGGNHSLAIDTEGNAWAWGRNNSGQLGNNSTADQSNVPVKVTMPKGVHFTQVSAGDDYSLAIGDDGNTYAWGYNLYGELGNNSTIQQSSVPVKVTMPDGVHFTQVSAGDSHSLAIGSDGNTYAWGWNNKGQLGNNSTDNSHVPVKVKALDSVRFMQVSAGFNSSSLALDTEGNAWAWGYGSDRQLGNGSTDDQHMPKMVTMPTGVRFTQVSASGYSHSLALDTDGNAWSWGTGYYGELGYGHSSNYSYTPRQVSMPDGVKFTQVSAGDMLSVALDTSGYAWAWGGAYGYQLGYGGAEDQFAPVKVIGAPYKQMDAGDGYTIAVNSEGNAKGWGRNGFGNIGNGKTGSAAIADSTVQHFPGVSTDPTAVPVEPVSTTSDGSDTIRVYNLPYTVNPGGYVIYHFNGTVDRTTAEQLIHNQAWFDSPDTPYAVASGGKITQGVPHVLGRTTTVPDKPDDAKLDRNSHDVTGNQSCMTGSDYSKPDMEHWFSTSAEDSCDQVGAVIPATSNTPVLGSISGLYWRDLNKDGIRQDTETDRIPGQQVILEDTNGKQLATTVTDGNGEYKFDKLKLDTYRVRFSRVTRADFTEVDANDPTTATATNTDGSSTDSDAGTSDDDYGMGTPTITLTTENRNKEHVDAGVLPDKPYTSMLPFTGVIILPLVLLLSIGFLIGAIILLRQPKTGGHDPSPELTSTVQSDDDPSTGTMDEQPVPVSTGTIQHLEPDGKGGDPISN